MSGVIVSRPIREGKVDEYRQFVADLMGPRRTEWAQSKRRRGITHVTVAEAWLEDRPMAVLYVEGDDPERSMAALTDSDDPFDRWLIAKQAEILGDRLRVDILGDTAPPSGPWRGMRRRFRWRTSR